MVQRISEGRDTLSHRFTRVEQVRLERQRQEKMGSPELTRTEMMEAAERCRRVLFEPDENLQGWVDVELNKISDIKKTNWNFDFKTGVPANEPSHPWKWGLSLPRASTQLRMGPLSPWVASLNSTRNLKKVVKPNSCAKTLTQRKITQYMNQRKYLLKKKTPASEEKPPQRDDSDSSDGEENTPMSTD